MSGEAPAWQALLFVPVGAERHLDSAIRNRPDAVILDLEDAIPADRKQEARERLPAFQARLAEAGIACVVRVNAPLAMLVADLAALNPDRTDAVMVPKCETARVLDNIAELGGDALRTIALIESPAGVAAIDTIAAHPSVAGLMIGSEDLSAAVGVDPDSGVLAMPVARLAMAAATRGLLAIGFAGSIANFRNLELYRSQIAAARALGMNAVAAIHPAQLPVIRAALAPADHEIAWAERIVAAMAGKTLGTVDGMMVDAPVMARARRIMARSRA